MSGSSKQIVKFPIDIALVDIRSAYNVGAIFRTCDGAGIRTLYLSGFTPYPPHNRIPKTALGSVEKMDWHREDSTQNLITKLKSEGKRIVLAETGANAVPLFDYKFQPNSVIVFANEVEGSSGELLAAADDIVCAPMYGYKQSLNVATTAGIFAYFAAAQMQTGEHFESIKEIQLDEQA